MKNPTDFLLQVTKLPAAIEAKLPAGAPKLSATLVDIAGKLPKLPDFPVTLPDLPEPPTMPGAPAPVAATYVAGAQLRARSAVAPAREIVPLIFE